LTETNNGKKVLLRYWGHMHNNILVYAETSSYVGTNKFGTNRDKSTNFVMH